MNEFNFYTPTKIVFGKNCESQAGALIRAAGKTKVLVLYGGGSVLKNGVMEKVEASLKQANVDYILLGGVKPNPVISFSKEAVKTALHEKVDFILAVGGGSVIDAAKAIALGTANPDKTIWSFFTREETPAAALPVGVVLTISAAGSETSNSCVQTNDEDGNIKRGLSHDFNRPLFALMNPENTYTLPVYQIACGITDIMMHTLDRYFIAKNEQGNELTDQIAEALLRTVIRYGAVAVKNTSDYQAASELMWAGSLSHNGLTGLGTSGDFAPHQLGHELSGKYDVAHGASLAAVWRAWANFVCSSDPARFARYARNVWGVTDHDDASAAAIGIEKTVVFFRELGMPVSIAELNIGKIDDETLRELAGKCTDFGKRTIGNIRVLADNEIFQIYKNAL